MAQCRQETGLDQRGLAAPGGTEHGEEPRAPQLFEQLRHSTIPTEEEVSVRLLERSQAAVWADRLLGGRRRWPRRDAVHRLDQLADDLVTTDAGAQVEPTAQAQERWKLDRRIERSSRTGKEDRHDAVPGPLGRPVKRHLQLLPSPVTDAGRSDEDQAAVAASQTIGQLVLPVVARRDPPTIEPDGQVRSSEAQRQLLDGIGVDAVVRQEDVVVTIALSGFGLEDRLGHVTTMDALCVGPLTKYWVPFWSTVTVHVPAPLIARVTSAEAPVSTTSWLSGQTPPPVT